MKIKINWKELGKQLWNAVKPVLLGALGGGLVAVTGSGCSALTPSRPSNTSGFAAAYAHSSSSCALNSSRWKS